jgi:hypothetical protein
LPKVGTFEEKGRIEAFGERVGNAIAKVEARLRMNGLPKEGIGADGGLRLSRVEADRFGLDEIKVLEELVNACDAAAEQQDNRGFIDVKNGYEATVGFGDHLDEIPALWLFLQNGDKGGGINDDQSKTPCSL